MSKTRDIDLDNNNTSKIPDLERGHNYLFVIAIDAYSPPIPRLENCVRDAEAFIAAILDRYAFFSQEKTIFLRDAQATRSAIRKQLDYYCNTLTDKDSLLIYYAGHGEVDPLTKEGYWIPADSKGEYQDDGIPNNVVTARLKEETLKARHVLLISDSCFSGSFFGKRSTTTDLKSQALEAVERRSSRWAITSGGHEPVADGEAHSPFAKRLLEYLNTYAETGFKAVSLGDNIQDLVVLNTQGAQTPRNEALGIGHGGGQFIFYLKEAQKPLTPEDLAYQKLMKSRSKTDISAFLEQFPESSHFQNVLDLLSEVEEEASWKQALQQDTLAAYYSFKKKYPKGKFLEKANQRINALNNTPEPAPDEPVKVPDPSPQPEPIRQNNGQQNSPYLFDDWQNLIAQGKVKEALQSIKTYLEAKNDNYTLNTVILLSGQLSRLNQESLRGTISYADATRQQAGIAASLLDIISDLKRKA